MEATKVVEALKKSIALLDEEDKALAPMLEEAIKCIGLCLACQGRGVQYYTNHNRQGGHRMRNLRGGGALYEYPCNKCDGAGQRLEVLCASCQKKFSPAPRPRLTQVDIVFMDDLCDNCFGSREIKSGLVPLDQPKPTDETKKLEAVPTPVKNENQGPKTKGGKR
jgi:hypothetical protein